MQFILVLSFHTCSAYLNISEG